MAHQLVCFFFPPQTSEQKISGPQTLSWHTLSLHNELDATKSPEQPREAPQKLQKWWDVMSVGSGWTLFPQPDSQGWANRRSFAPNQHDPGSPRTGVPDSDRWGSVSRSGEAGGREGSPERGVAINPNSEKLWLTGDSALCQSGGGTPWPGHKEGGPLWVHTFTPGQIARHARESSPPISTHLLHPSSSPSPKKHAIWGAIGCLLTFSAQPSESLALLSATHGRLRALGSIFTTL